MAREALAEFRKDPDGLALRVEAGEAGTLAGWFGERELEVPDGVVAWVERAGTPGRVARSGDHEAPPFTAVLVREARTTVAFTVADLRTAEGFPAEARVELDLGVDVVTPDGLRAFARQLFTTGPAFGRRELLLHLEPAVAAAWRALAAETPARDLCAGDPTERIERVLRARLRRPCFDGGLELLAVRRAAVRCPEWTRLAAEGVDAAVAEARERNHAVLRETWLKERRQQALSRDELAEFYAALEHDGALRDLAREREKAERERDVARVRAEVEAERSRGELRQLDDFLGTLERAGVRDVFERYLDLLAGGSAGRRRAAAAGLPAAAVAGRTRRILTVAGDRVLAFEPGAADGSGPAETWDAGAAGAGGLRSVRVLDLDGAPFVVAGGQRGLWLRPLHGDGPARVLPYPEGRGGAGGANACAAVGPGLVASHSELGLCWYDLREPTTPGRLVRGDLTAGARTVRGVQAGEGRVWFAVDDRVLALGAARFPEGTPTVYRGAGATVTALAATATHVYAGTSEGRVWRWAVGDPEHPEAELPRREGPVTGLRPAVLNGAPVLLVTWGGYAVCAKLLGEPTELHFHAEAPVRWAAGASDLVAGIERDGRTLLCWEPNRPATRWRRFAAPDRMQDVWLWRDAEASA